MEAWIGLELELLGYREFLFCDSSGHTVFPFLRDGSLCFFLHLFQMNSRHNLVNSAFPPELSVRNSDSELTCFLYVVFQTGGREFTWLVSDSPDVFGSPVPSVPRCPFPCFCLDTHMWTPFLEAEVGAGGKKNPAPRPLLMGAAFSHPALGNLDIMAPGVCHAS